MKLVSRLRRDGSTATEATKEAADAIEQLCEMLETCWEKYETAITFERESCAVVAEECDTMGSGFRDNELSVEDYVVRQKVRQIAAAIRARK